MTGTLRKIQKLNELENKVIEVILELHNYFPEQNETHVIIQHLKKVTSNINNIRIQTIKE